MDEIATGSFKLDACGGPKQAGPFLSVERRLKYIRFYVDLRQTAKKCFFSFKSKLSGLS